jgi:hypothetical protein
VHWQPGALSGSLISTSRPHLLAAVECLTERPAEVGRAAPDGLIFPLVRVASGA